MCRCKITAPGVELDFQIHPSADFMACMVPAIIAALPTFIQAFMDCMSGSDTGDNYRPGDRPRCTKTDAE